MTVVTQWVENATGGRARGPRALLVAWLDALVRPRTFFRSSVAPGDQSAGLTFALAVVAVYLSTQFAFAPELVPTFSGFPRLSAVLVVGLLVVLVAPLVLHLVAALQTLVLVPFVDDRAGVSETVQVFAYATAPCVFAGLPIPALQAACPLYGAFLATVGVSVRHDISFARAVVLTAIPNLVVFGFAFGGLAAVDQIQIPL